VNSLRDGLLGALLLAALFSVGTSFAADTLVPAGSVWKYCAITNDVGTSWKDPWYDDSAWPQGPAQLGYGDQDEVTVVPFFYDQIGLKNISTYFRHTFVASNAFFYTNLLVRLLRDDGAVVYLNGVELFRSNMPTGEVTHSTLALLNVGPPEENTLFLPTNVPPTWLFNGTNLLAVEIHQVLPQSADISFDLELVAQAPASRPPVVTFATPFPGAVFSPGTNIPLMATTSDPDGTVARVEFFADDASLGVDSAPPFTATWSNATIGPHTLRARATDNTGVTTDTAPLLIQVGGMTILSAGAGWKYLDDQTDPGTAWRMPAFDDSGWSNGVAPLGFGDGDEATVIRWKIADVPIVTAYFRCQFVSPNPANFSGLMLRLLRDDGGVVYLNGVEVFRSNMPQGDVNYRTYALEPVGIGPEENVIFFPTNLPPYVLVEGTNTLAVEIHQITQFSSTDISFDCELTGFPTADASRLTVSANAGHLELTWPAWTDRFKVFAAGSLSPNDVWSPVDASAENISGNWTVRLPLSGGSQFYRLQTP